MVSQRNTKKLETIIRLATEVLEQARLEKTSPPGGGQKRTRRSGKELAAFRKMLKTERKRGTPVAELAKQHGISQAYIYQLR